MATLLSLALATATSFAVAVHEQKIFGVPFRWETNTDSGAEALQAAIAHQTRELAQGLDPDCRWRPRTKSVCDNDFPLRTEAAQRLADKVKQETGGVFNVLTLGKERKPQRDFDGLSQGFFLRGLQDYAKEPWMADFAGDIFIAPTFQPSRPLVVTDPLIEAVTYADVSMPGGGWMIASAGRSMGAALRNGKKFGALQKVVLFAAPDFDGGRLDAWATAIAAGGRTTLERLVARKEDAGRWAYFAFDAKSKPFWSSNIRFEKTAVVSRIDVPAWSAQ